MSTFQITAEEFAKLVAAATAPTGENLAFWLDRKTGEGFAHVGVQVGLPLSADPVAGSTQYWFATQVVGGWLETISLRGKVEFDVSEVLLDFRRREAEAAAEAAGFDIETEEGRVEANIRLHLMLTPPSIVTLPGRDAAALAKFREEFGE